VKRQKSLLSAENFDTDTGQERFNIGGGLLGTGLGLLEPTLEDRKRRWASLGAGTAVEAVVVAGLCWVGLALSYSNTPPALRKEIWSTRITLPTPEESPAPEVPHRRPVPLLEAPKPQVSPKPLAAARPLPEPVIPRVPAIAPPHPILHAPDAAGNVPQLRMTTPPSPRWQPQVRLGAFGNSSNAATLPVPAKAVQTGGFGNPNGFPGEAQGGSHANVAHLGSFDLPVGPGRGNGTGGAQGAIGTVASADLGNGIAGPGEGGTPRSGAVQPGGFTDAQAQAQSASQIPRAARTPDTPKIEPVEILSKPNPVYTEEARRLHIQGEVLLQVVFMASEELRVVRVVKGLGHGLDEAALQAAEQIRFKPARRDGQPVDTTATLHVLFQLAD